MNLFEISSFLQKIPESPEGTKTLMDYANGQSSMVPSYVALAELNRRKLLKDTEAASIQAPQQSLKDQLASELLGGQAAQNQQRYGVNPAAPPQMVNPAAPPPMVNPAQPMVPQGMAEGGLASVPLDMFKRSNFAPGGIVAFGDPKLNPDEDQLVEVILEGQDELRGGAKSDTLKTNKQLSATASGKIPEIKKEKEPEAGLPALRANPITVREAPTFEQEREDLKKRKAALGISDDPYADVRALRSQFEKMQEDRYKREPQERLMAVLGGEHPSGNFFMGLGAGAQKAQEIGRLNQEKREKDFEKKIEFAKLDAQEQQARKEGDLAKIEASMAAKAKLVQEDRRDQIAFDQATASLTSASASQLNALTQQRQENRAERGEELAQSLIKAQIAERQAAAAAHSRPPAEQTMINNVLGELRKKNPNAGYIDALRVMGDIKGGPNKSGLSYEEAYKLAATGDPLWFKKTEAEKNAAVRALMSADQSTRQGISSLPAAASTAVPTGPTATNPKTGEKVQLINGQWVPVGR